MGPHVMRGLRPAAGSSQTIYQFIDIPIAFSEQWAGLHLRYHVDIQVCKVVMAVRFLAFKAPLQDPLIHASSPGFPGDCNLFGIFLRS